MTKALPFTVLKEKSEVVLALIDDCDQFDQLAILDLTRRKIIDWSIRKRQLSAMRFRLNGLTWEDVGKRLPYGAERFGVSAARARQLAFAGLKHLRGQPDLDGDDLSLRLEFENSPLGGIPSAWQARES